MHHFKCGVRKVPEIFMLYIFYAFGILETSPCRLKYKITLLTRNVVDIHVFALDNPFQNDNIYLFIYIYVYMYYLKHEQECFIG